MNISEMRAKLEKRKKTVPQMDCCSWNPMSENAPFDLEEEVDKEDSEYETDDDEQNFLQALSLLDTAEDLLIAAAKFLDARNLSLPGDTDWAVTRTCLDIRQFLSSFDFKKAGIKEVKHGRKTTAMGPASMKGIVSHECRHTRHNWCPLVNCDCACHKDETIREHISHETDVLGQSTPEPDPSKDSGMAPL